MNNMERGPKGDFNDPEDEASKDVKHEIEQAGTIDDLCTVLRENSHDITWVDRKTPEEVIDYIKEIEQAAAEKDFDKVNELIEETPLIAWGVHKIDLGEKVSSLLSEKSEK